MKILILCTGNSCRSQMAHGFLQSFDKNIQVFSAGTKPAEKVNPMAVKVMSEVGIDIGHHIPKSINHFLGQQWDYVITVCGGANESCPMFTGKVEHRLHIGFDDPSEVIGAPEYIRTEFERVRNEIKVAFYSFYQEEILLKFLNERPDIIPICHCGRITLGDIKNAVRAGCLDIKDIRDFTNKHETRNCSKSSPDAQCCYNRFNKVINQLIKK